MAKIAKPWKLTEEETFSSFTSWQHNMTYTLGQDATFAPFLKEGAVWGKLTSTKPTRDLQDDGGNGLKKEAKVTNLNCMLRYITQWIPHYLANDVEKNSTNIDSVWGFIRKYYSFQQSETQFMKFTSIKMEDTERPERLYQRILAHLQDNLLKKDGKLKHDGVQVTTDEDISPTVERLAVLRWMEVIDEDLPAYVARTFAYDLQRMSLKDLQPQIVDAMDGFLAEIRSKRVSCSRSYVGRGRSKAPMRHNERKPPVRPNMTLPTPYVKPYAQSMSCRVCKAEGRSHTNHTLASCDYISKAEKRDIIHTFRVDADCLENEPLSELTDKFGDVDVDDQA